MKKRTKNLYRSFGPVKIYLNDLHQTIEMLKEIPGECELIIQTSDYEFSTLEGVEELKQESVGEIHVKCFWREPSWVSLSMDIEKKRTTLTCSEDTPALRGVFHSLEQLLLSRRRRFQWAETFFFFATGSGTSATIFLLW